MSTLYNGGDKMSDVDILYQIASLKDIDYKNTLIITSLIDILVEKGIISKNELMLHARRLDEYAVSSRDYNDI